MIKCFITDIDGVLTDSTYYVLPSGERIKKFNTRDFVGLRLLNESGIKVVVLTGESGDDCVDHQIFRAAPFCIFKNNSTDKVEDANQILRNLGLYFYETAFIGDDINDIDLIRLAGYAACPSDAVDLVLKEVSSRKDSFVSKFTGGSGCVRDFSELVLSLKGMNL